MFKRTYLRGQIGLARMLLYGALPVKIDILEQRIPNTRDKAGKPA
jgi:hypothetical protein